MGQIGFDIALGREVELWNRVDGNDPTNSVIVIMVLAHSGLVSDPTLKAYASFSAILAGASNEVTNTNYARKVLTDANVSPVTVDNTFHTVTITLADQTFTSIAAGDSWSKWVMGYDPDSTGGTDADIVPFAAGDLRIDGSPVVPNGNNIIMSWPDGVAVGR